ncbi:MAG: hypothetical protein HY318_12725 [Armatimonadetes bacterium]|nr:hypothetical protein [Armatimonadota bacterium]
MANQSAQPAGWKGLIAVDLWQQKVEARIPLDISALAIVHLSPQGDKAYVVTAGATGSRNVERGRLLLVDLSQRRVSANVNLGLNPLDSVMTPDGRKLFTADWGSRSISVVDLEAAKLLDTIPLGLNPVRVLAISPDGKKVYAVQENVMPEAVMAQALRNYDTTRAAVNTQSQTIQNIARTPVEGNLLWEIDAATSVVSKSPFDGLSPVYALAVSADGKRLYAYGRTMAPLNSATNAPGQEQIPRPPPTAQAEQQAHQQVQQRPAPRVETYDLVVFDLVTRKILKRLGNFGFVASMALSTDGSKLYLVGTPGDPAREDNVQKKNLARQQVMDNASKQALEERSNELLKDLSQLPKTVTVLNAETGARLTSITIGSLPQGCAILK